ncbi:MAG: M12 family metallo-peptidase [Pyrinomonadaceae bacterium]
MKLAKIVALLIFVMSTSSIFGQSKGTKVFRLSSQPTAMSFEARSSIASRREAEIAFDRAASARVASLNSIEIELFDGKTFTAVRSSTEIRSLEDSTWRGKIDPNGKMPGDVVLTFRKGHIAGLIFSPDAVYEIVPRGDKHFLVELDQSAFPECAGDMQGEPAKTQESPSGGADSGDRIDVLVVYTAAVRTSLGGDAQAQAVAQQAIDATNTSYINSRMRLRVRLVEAQLTALNETGSFSTELGNLRSDPATAILRNDKNADMVAMLTNSTASCGIGYLMGGQGGNPNNAFTVTARTCAVGNLSFAHELGHNMGSQHNPENGSGPTYPYGFGHYVNGSYRTVMSYVDPCTNGCTRVAYFSNPNVIFNGVPTGIINARDNARSIDNTADWIAGYRYSGSSITLGSLNTGEIARRVAARTINWSSDNLTGNVRIELSRNGSVNWETIIADTEDDGSQTISITGRPSGQARIRVTSLANPAVSDSSVINFKIQ